MKIIISCKKEIFEQYQDPQLGFEFKNETEFDEFL